LIFLSVAEFLSLSIIMIVAFCIQHLLNEYAKWVGHSLTIEFSVIACLVNLSIFYLNPLDYLILPPRLCPSSPKFFEFPWLLSCVVVQLPLFLFVESLLVVGIMY
jgi:hypothetical protein